MNKMQTDGISVTEADSSPSLTRSEMAGLAANSPEESSALSTGEQNLATNLSVGAASTNKTPASEDMKDATPPADQANHVIEARPSLNTMQGYESLSSHLDPMQASQIYSQSGQRPNPAGTKAKRKRASPHQVALLNQIYEYTSFPSTELRIAIGKELGMAPRTVQIWFQNRRQAWKSQKSRETAEECRKARDNERGGWEVLRSFQARRANGEIQEYEYMAVPIGQNVGGEGANGMTIVPYHPAMIQVALSSNDQFNSSMQQLPMPLPHTPRPNPAHFQPRESDHSYAEQGGIPAKEDTSADVVDGAVVKSLSEEP